MPPPQAGELSEVECLRLDLARVQAALRHELRSTQRADEALRAIEARASRQLDELRGELAEAHQAQAACQTARDRLAAEVDVLRGSYTWRAGRVVTAVPRWVRERRGG